MTEREKALASALAFASVLAVALLTIIGFNLPKIQESDPSPTGHSYGTTFHPQPRPDFTLTHKGGTP